MPVASYIRNAAVARAEDADHGTLFLTWWAVLLSMLRPGRCGSQVGAMSLIRGSVGLLVGPVTRILSP